MIDAVDVQEISKYRDPEQKSSQTRASPWESFTPLIVRAILGRIDNLTMARHFRVSIIDQRASTH
jgi:hypothetical protein